MFKHLGIAQPTLTIHPDLNSFFLHPSPDPEHTPAEDVVIHGKLVLSLPKAKRLRSINVRVVQHYNMAFPDLQYEAGHRTISEASIFKHKTAERLFEKGDHTLQFSLVVPSSTAPFERSQFGRIYFELVACAEGDGMLESNITARAPILLVVNPAPIGETLDLDAHVQGFSDELGPYAISATTQHLTVGGLMAVSVVLPQALHKTRIVSIAADIDGYYTLTSVSGQTKSLDRRQSITQHSTKHHKVFSVNSQNLPNHCHMISESRWPCGDLRTKSSEDLESSVQITAPTSSKGSSAAKVTSRVATPAPLEVIEHDGSYHMNHLCRMPNDDVLRPSTMSGTITPIHVRHELSIYVKFQIEDDCGVLGPVHVLKTNSPIMISSCCCQLGSILVPAYSEIDPLPFESSPLSPVSSTSSTNSSTFSPTTSPSPSSSSSSSVTPPTSAKTTPNSNSTIPTPTFKPSFKPKPQAPSSLPSAYVTNPFYSWDRCGQACVCSRSMDELIAQQKLQNEKFEQEWQSGHLRLVDGMIRRQLFASSVPGADTSTSTGAELESGPDGRRNGKFEYVRVGTSA